MADDLAERILQYRIMENISQQEMADRCKVSLQTIWSIENGQQNPSPLTRGKIEYVIGNAGRE